MIDWGHNYGNLFLEYPELDLPPLKVERVIGDRVAGYEGPQYGLCLADPLNIPGLCSLLRETENIKTNKKYLVQTCYRSSAKEQSFDKLPIELLLKVLVYLSSSDIRNLKLASRSFAILK